MEWLRIIGFCILTAAMIMMLKQVNPVFSGILCAAFGVMVMLSFLPQIRMHLESIRTFLSLLRLDSEYFAVMLKAIGIVLITQSASLLCLEMDAPYVARRVEFCGRVTLLGIAVPVYIELTKLAVEVLG